MNGHNAQLKSALTTMASPSETQKGTLTMFTRYVNEHPRMNEQQAH